jgi:threonine synthase
MNYTAWFQCIKCGEKYELTEIVYKCKKCGALLDVEHNLDALKEKDADYWKELFDARYGIGEYPYNSGVWGKKEWVLPEIPNDSVVSLGEGITPLVNISEFGKNFGVKNLWIKQCGISHTGSFKDLGLTVLVSQVNYMIRKLGFGIDAIACASTGDTSAAVASYSAKANIPSIVFLPRGKISLAQLIQPISNGAMVLAIDTDFDGCMKIVQEITKDNRIYLANSMNSLRIEGQKTVSIELTQQLGWEAPDWVIIPGGNLGNVSALGRGFLMMKELGIINKLPRICVAQSERANPLYLSYLTNFQEFKPVKAKETVATAIRIGNPVSKDRAINTLKKFNGIVVQASEDELSNAAALLDLYGLYTCPHTGVATAGFIKLANQGIIKENDKVVIISTAHGLKFTEFKLKYHEQDLKDVISKYPNKPIELPADINVIKKELYKELAKRKR